MSILIEAAVKTRAVQPIPPVLATTPDGSSATFRSALRWIAPNGDQPIKFKFDAGELATTRWPRGANRPASCPTAPRAADLAGGVIWTNPAAGMRANMPGSGPRAKSLAPGVCPSLTASARGASRGDMAGMDIPPSSRALRMATDAVSRGYGLTDTETTAHPAIIAQAMELSFLLEAYGLVRDETEERGETGGRGTAIA